MIYLLSFSLLTLRLNWGVWIFANRRKSVHSDVDCRLGRRRMTHVTGNALPTSSPHTCPRSTWLREAEHQRQFLCCLATGWWKTIGAIRLGIEQGAELFVRARGEDYNQTQNRHTLKRNMHTLTEHRNGNETICCPNLSSFQWKHNTEHYSFCQQGEMDKLRHKKFGVIKSQEKLRGGKKTSIYLRLSIQ